MTVDFKYTIKGLLVSFKNLSTDFPDDYKFIWDFGDGNFSEEAHPTHKYPRSGVYSVTLKVVNPLGSTIAQYEDEVLVSVNVKTHLSDSIYNLIDTYIPPYIYGKIPFKIKRQFIEKWQLYLQPLVNHTIPIEEFNNELYYEALENQLIMELAAYDFLVIQITNLIKASSQTVVDNNSNSQSRNGDDGSQVNSGAVKKITTGPTEVEYFDGGASDNDSSSNVIKAMQPGGVIDLLKQEICMLAERLDIYLPICSRIRSTVIEPKVVNRRKGGYLSGPDPIEVLR